VRLSEVERARERERERERERKRRVRGCRVREGGKDGGERVKIGAAQMRSLRRAAASHVALPAKLRGIKKLRGGHSGTAVCSLYARCARCVRWDTAAQRCVPCVRAPYLGVGLLVAEETIAVVARQRLHHLLRMRGSSCHHLLYTPGSSQQLLSVAQ
jgi:hypothetical protein